MGLLPPALAPIPAARELLGGNAGHVPHGPGMGWGLGVGPHAGDPRCGSAHAHRARTETTSAMQRFRLPLSSLMVMGRSSLILSIASGQSS